MEEKALAVLVGFIIGLVFGGLLGAVAFAAVGYLFMATSSTSPQS